MIFYTERLQIRNLTLTDFDEFYEMQGNQTVMQFTTGKAQTKDESLQDLKNVIEKYQQANNGFWVWAIALKTNNNLVGTCALIVNEQQEFEFGIRLLQREFKKGFAFEASKALLTYAKSNFNHECLMAYVDISNKDSIKLLEQLGFKKIAEISPNPFNNIDFKYQLNLHEV